MARVLVLSYSELGRDPRVDRQVRFLSEEHEVVTAGFAPPSDPSIEHHDVLFRDFEGWAHLLPRMVTSPPMMASGRWRRPHWAMPLHAHAARQLAGLDVDLVLVNDVAGLPLAFRVARGKPVVLDAHEHAPSEYAERRVWRIVHRPYVRAICREFLPRLAAMTTVSQGIADLYSQEFGVEVEVVLNAPYFADLQPTEVHAPLRLIHHGIGAERRHLHLLIDAVAPLPEKVTLDLMLAPGSQEYIDELSRRAAATKNARVIPPVPYAEMVPKVNQYDVGVHLIPDSGIEHDYYALPNKFFEFVQGRVALAISPSPDMVRLVEQFGCGVVADSATAPALTRVLSELDADRVRELKQASHRAASVLNAEQTREQLLRIVDDALGAGRGAPAAA